MIFQTTIVYERKKEEDKRSRYNKKYLFEEMAPFSLVFLPGITDWIKNHKAEKQEKNNRNQQNQVEPIQKFYHIRIYSHTNVGYLADKRE